MPRIPLTPISVDDFSYQPGVTIYLLTHLHTDHLKGLSPSWDHGTVVGSSVTIGLLKRRMPGLKDEVLRGVDVGTVLRQQVDKAGHEMVDILVLHAEHCLGSVMYLAKGYFGHILCTGDFRWSASKRFLSDIPELQRDTIDDLYLDDTFLDPAHDFPDWPTATNQIIQFLTHLEKSDGKPLDKILVKVDLWGKEELLVTLARHFNTLIVVTRERMDMLEIPLGLGLIPDVWTTIPTEGRIVTVSYKPKDSNIAYLSKQAGGATMAAIIPSGWVGTKPEISAGGRVLRVGYSAHSSYSEILDFVDWLRPQCVQGTSRGDHNEAVRKHLRHLIRNYPAPPRTVIDRLEKGQLVPKSVSATFSRVAAPVGAHGRGGPLGCKATPVRRRGIHLKEATPTQDSVDVEGPGVVSTPPEQVEKGLGGSITPGTGKTAESSSCLFKDTSDEEEEGEEEEEEGFRSLEDPLTPPPVPPGPVPVAATTPEHPVTEPDLLPAYSLLADITGKLHAPPTKPPLPPKNLARRLVSIDTEPSTQDSLLADLIESDAVPRKLAWRPPTPPKHSKKRKVAAGTQAEPLVTTKTQGKTAR